jgi:hypothetical protein
MGWRNYAMVKNLELAMSIMGDLPEKYQIQAASQLKVILRKAEVDLSAELRRQDAKVARRAKKLMAPLRKARAQQGG